MDLNSDIQILQNWFSPSFPIGSFAYSHGLETAIEDKVVSDPATLTDWVSFILEYEFSNKIIELSIKPVFTSIMSSILDSFISEAFKVKYEK